MEWEAPNGCPGGQSYELLGFQEKMKVTKKRGPASAMLCFGGYLRTKEKRGRRQIVESVGKKQTIVCLNIDSNEYFSMGLDLTLETSLFEQQGCFTVAS